MYSHTNFMLLRLALLLLLFLVLLCSILLLVVLLLLGAFGAGAVVLRVLEYKTTKAFSTGVLNWGYEGRTKEGGAPSSYVHGGT